IYGVIGTLNMADLAVRIPRVSPESMMMLEAGAGILGIAFLIKAGMWPLAFWLPTTYTATPAPVAAIMAIMSKVGVYVILRLSLLFFSEETVSAGFGTNALLLGGLATITFGAIGVLASQSLGRLAGFSVLVSSGTLLASLGLFEAGVTAGALLYLVSSTVAISAFFLLIELVERGQDQISNVLAVTVEAFGDEEVDEDFEEEVGVVIPGTLAILGISFGACALLLAGLPPLPGFVAKFVIIDAGMNPGGADGGSVISPSAWWLTAFLILSGLASLISMSRAGIRAFWAPVDAVVPRVLVTEILPIAALLVLTFAITVQAGPIMRFMQATADNLHDPRIYIESVIDAPRAVAPMRETTQ